MSLRDLIVMLTVAWSGVAAADDKTACVTSYSSAQDLRVAGNLVDAERQLRLCAGATCPTFITRECTKWLDEVSSSIPTIVVSATDGGHDVTEVSVTVDGAPVIERLDGRAVAMNPGLHVFVYWYGKAAVTEQVLVRMGEKNRVLEVVFAQPKRELVEDHATVAPIVIVKAPVAKAPVTTTSALETAGFVTIGVGAAVLAAGAIFGLTAIVTEGSDCMSGLCDPGTVASLQTETTLSTIGFIAGAVVAATGVVLAVIGRNHRVNVVAARVGGGVDFRW